MPSWGVSLGSARVSRAGFGVAPKQSFLEFVPVDVEDPEGKVRDGEDNIASTRDACATHIAGKLRRAAGQARLRHSTEFLLSLRIANV